MSLCNPSAMSESFEVMFMMLTLLLKSHENVPLNLWKSHVLYVIKLLKSHRRINYAIP